MGFINGSIHSVLASTKSGIKCHNSQTLMTKWYYSNSSSPCGNYAQSVLGYDPANECDSCKHWIHIRWCSQVTDLHYQHVQATNCVWIRPACNKSN